MADIFQEAKSRLTMVEVAQHYGFHPNRAGFIHCPFHAGDRTASLKIYPDGYGWHCFGCNRGGSVIDFVRDLYGIDAFSALQKLNDDFRLGLHLGRPQTVQECREAKQAAQRRREITDIYKAFEQWRGTLLDKLNACFRLAHVTMRECRRLDKLTAQEALAIQRQAHIEYLADLLAFGDLEDQMKVFRQRKEVTALCNRILPDMPMKSEAA